MAETTISKISKITGKQVNAIITTIPKDKLKEKIIADARNSIIISVPEMDPESTQGNPSIFVTDNDGKLYLVFGNENN